MWNKTFFRLTVLAVSVAGISAAQADELTDHTIRVGGKQRAYHVHRGPALTRPVPLVVVLHGGGGNGKMLKDTYGFKPFIERGELIAVYPDSGPGGWLPEHVEFVDAVIDEVFAREKVDRQRLFVTGASRGGLLTFVMAAKSKHSIRAAGTVIASQLAGLARDYPIKRPIDFAMIAGTADPLMPYHGGWGAMRKPKTTGKPDGRVLPVEESIGLVLKAIGLGGKPVISSLGNKDPNDGCSNEVRTWTDAKTGRRVMLVKVEGGGHVVPGGRQYLPKSVIGPVCNDFNHAQVMWQFFRSSGKNGSVGSAAAGTTTPAPPTGKSLDAAAEKALRERVGALFDALLDGNVAKCIDLSDPQVVKEKGRAIVEKFFKGVSGLIRFAKIKPGDRSVQSIDFDADSQSARVTIDFKINGKPQKPAIETWKLVDGQWYYRETAK